jgi:hypothetical protein
MLIPKAEVVIAPSLAIAFAGDEAFPSSLAAYGVSTSTGRPARPDLAAAGR